jgi:methanesulfonate monooxygenase large subunit
MSRSAQEWERRPSLPQTHYVDPRIYTDQRLFADEQKLIFGASWLLACHDSELPQPGDFRTYSHPAGVNLVLVRGEDLQVRAFFNVCAHRGNTIALDPAGNSKTLTCIYHMWSYDTEGRCVGIPREREGYGDRLCKADFGLRRVRAERDVAGFIYVNLDEDAVSLADYQGRALDGMAQALGSEPLEVFSFHRAVIESNWKWYNETNSEFYHDYLHYFNRQTSMLQPGYAERKYVGFPNGHVVIGDQIVNYEAYRGEQSRETTFPGLRPNQWKLTVLFPGIMYNIRGSAMRVDSVIPLGPTQLAIEYRGVGLRRDTEAERARRVRDYNTIWGILGRNLHEDLLASHGLGKSAGRGQTFGVHAREEDATIHDELGVRHFYAEWGRRLGRSAADPFSEQRRRLIDEERRRLIDPLEVPVG